MSIILLSINPIEQLHFILPQMTNIYVLIHSPLDNTYYVDNYTLEDFVN